MAAADAQAFWMSAKVPDDQLAVYTFAGVPDDLDAVLVHLTERARACPDLGLRIDDDHVLRYPAWVSGPVTPDQFVVHDEPPDWTGCLDVLAGLVDCQLDARVATWRLHIFTPVTGAPGAAGPVTVVALQATHSFGDGTRTAQVAGWLFGRSTPVSPVLGERRGSLVLRSIAAARTHRQMTQAMAAGELPPPPAPRPALLTNAAPVGPRRVRTLVRDRSALPGESTVTVAVLVAVSTALGGYLSARGEDIGHLGAEVPMRAPGTRHAHNHYRNVAVGLYPELAPGPRAVQIETELRGGRVRAEHPATLASRRSFAAIPAPVLRWGVGHFDPAMRSPMVTGNTVVSSVNRGPADLRFGTAPVMMTSGYPGLSPMMALTHGVHGIGDTIALSVHAAESVIDVDDYLARLDRAL